MKFLRQVKFEITNILRSKFLLIIAIIVLAASVLVPVGTLIFEPKPGDVIGRPIPMGGVYYSKDFGPDSSGQEPIVVNGVTIKGDNPFYWELQNLIQEKSMLETDKARFTNPETVDLVQALIEAEINNFVKFAQSILTYQDYRYDLGWSSRESIGEAFFLERVGTVPEAAFLEAAMYRKGMDNEALKKKYIDITAAERLEALGKAQDMLERLYHVVENDDFNAYVDLRIEQERKRIEDIEANIKIQEQAIIDNPDQEENLNQYIEQMRREIRNIEESTIWTLEFRREKQIKPGLDIWQNRALGDAENYRRMIVDTVIFDEEQYKQNPYLAQQYGTYQRYVEKMQAQINSYNNIVQIASNSLNAGKPDMKYVDRGARNRTTGFLAYSSIVALFGVLLGGWLIASEYQQGTIRLLMIRPKTRIKILMAKYSGSLLVLLAIYVCGLALNAVANGLCFGFADFGFPNYTISGEVAFLAYYLPRMLACVLPVLFGFTVAFMMSVLVKNTAVSIAVPVILFVGCLIVTTYFAFNSKMEWLAYTPIPYVDLSAFFVSTSTLQYAIQNGAAFNVPLGIGYLLGLAAIAMVTSVIVFKKRDITN